MPYVFSKIQKSLKDKKDKGFQTVEGGGTPVSVTSAPSQSGGVTGQGKTEASDTPSMKQYITQNKQDYDIEPVGEVYSAAKKRDLGEGTRIKTEEEKKYDEMVKSKEKPAWSAPQVSYNDYAFQSWTKPEPAKNTRAVDGLTVTSYENLEPVAPPTLADVAAPAPVNTAAYDTQVAALENYINQIKMYQPNEEELVPTSTAQALQMLGNRYDRQDLLRREFADETPNYTQGMLALDQALAEREGFDTRGMGQQYLQTKGQSAALQQGISGLRSGNVQERDTMSAQSAREQGEVQSQKQAAQSAYQQAQQRFSAYQAEKAKRDAAMNEYKQAQAAKLAQEKQAEAVSYQQKQQVARQAGIDSVEAQRRANYDKYVSQVNASNAQNKNAGISVAQMFARRKVDRLYRAYLAAVEYDKNTSASQGWGAVVGAKKNLKDAEEAYRRSVDAYKAIPPVTNKPTPVLSYEDWSRNNSNLSIAQGGALGQVTVGELPADMFNPDGTPK